MRKQKSKRKIYKIIFVIFALLILIYQGLVRIGNEQQDIKWGMAFSKPYAQWVGLDWRKLYIEMIDELGVKAIRLPFYWNEMEREPGSYDFADYDWMMTIAKEKNVEILPVIGKRLPRWPECHEPEWAKKMLKGERDEALLGWMKKVVERYKNYDNIKMWQVENEPFLTLFGKCEKPDSGLLDQEFALVKELTGKPVLVTDSGELSVWHKSSRAGDYLGTTVYRVVHNPWLGYWSYWFLPASTYRLKARLNLKPWDRMLVSELQAEPWYPDQESLLSSSLEEQFKSMNVERFKQNIAYTRSINFSTAYLWGVEWWWWLKEVKGDDSMWNEGKKLFSGIK